MKPAFSAGAALTLAMLPGCHRPPAVPRVARRRRGSPHRRRVADRGGAETASGVGRHDRAVPRRQDSVRVRHGRAHRPLARGASDRDRRAAARSRPDAAGEGFHPRAGTGRRSAVTRAGASRGGLADLARHRAGAPASHRLRVDTRTVVRTNRGGARRQSPGGPGARLAAGSLRPAVLLRFSVTVTGLDTVALVWMDQHSATPRTNVPHHRPNPTAR